MTLTVSGVHHVNLTVTNLAESARWYRDVLGLAPGWEMDDVDGRGQKIVLLVPKSALRIVLTKHRKNQGEPSSEFRTGLDHLALTVQDRDALEQWMDHLDRLQVNHSAIKEGATGWLITLRDPDNVQLELYTVSK